MDARYILGFSIAGLPPSRKKSVASSIKGMLGAGGDRNKAAALHLLLSPPFPANEPLDETADINMTLCYSSEPLDHDGAEILVPRLGAAIQCPHGFDRLLRSTITSGGTEHSASFLLSQLLAQRCGRLSAPVTSAPPTELTIFWTRADPPPFLRQLGPPPPHNISPSAESPSPLQQYYCLPRPALMTPIFVHELAIDGSLVLETAAAYLNAVCGSLDTSICGWEARSEQARICQRDFPSHEDAVASGYSAVEVTGGQMRARWPTAVSSKSYAGDDLRELISKASEKLLRVGGGGGLWNMGVDLLERGEHGLRPVWGQRAELRARPDNGGICELEGDARFHLLASPAACLLRVQLALAEGATLWGEFDLDTKDWVKLRSDNGEVDTEVELRLRVLVTVSSAPLTPQPWVSLDASAGYEWTVLCGMHGINPLAHDSLDCETLGGAAVNVLSLTFLADHIAALKNLRQELGEAAAGFVRADASAFRSSRDKKSVPLQALPVNLHRMLLAVWGDHELKGVLHSLSCGCLSPHSMGFRRGGLQSLAADLQADKSALEETIEKTLRAEHGAEHCTLRDALQSFEKLSLEFASRRVFALSQALSVTVCALMLKLDMTAAGQIPSSTCAEWTVSGFPIVFEGLLSPTNLVGKERGMAEDCTDAINALRLFSLRTEKSTDECRRVVVNGRTVCLQLPGRLLELLPVEYSTLAKITLVPVYFNQGIDIIQSLATSKAAAERSLMAAMTHLGSLPLPEKDEVSCASERQFETNIKALQILNDYLHACRPESDCTDQSIVMLGAAPARIHPALNRLHDSIVSTKHSSKNVDMLYELERISLNLNACKVTFCKSGKDRTGMSVTLEHSRILGEVFGCGEQQDRVLMNANLMRVYGTRIMIAEKNIGRRVYSINKLQAQFLPLLYRPPTVVQEDMLKTDET